MLGPAFLPAVVEHGSFQRDGILFGTESLSQLRLRWLVADPARHTMEVWHKSVPSLPQAATALGASAFTNGPFSDYGSGHFLGASARLAGDLFSLRRRVPSPADGADHSPSPMRASLFHYQATTPLGFVIGTASGIAETKVPRPRLHYFGRWQGRDFADYEIAQGDPFGLTEAVGGLFRGVQDYRPFLLDRFMRVGFWGLAPVDGDPVLARAGMPAALRAYTGPGRTCPGLLVFVAGWANTLRLTELLAAIRVKDAVQIDGSDSLLLGQANRLIMGSLMPPWKRLLQCWGMQLRATSLGPAPTQPPVTGAVS